MFIYKNIKEIEFYLVEGSSKIFGVSAQAQEQELFPPKTLAN